MEINGKPGNLEGMYRLVYFFIAIACAGCAYRKDLTAPGHLKVMTYNVHHCNPPKFPGKIDMNAIAKIINEARPDLVALQEIDVNTKRSGQIDQAKLLSEQTGMHVYFAKAIAYDGGDYGVAILSKHPIVSAHTYPLRNDGNTKSEPRVLAVATISLPGGKSIKFGSTHLDAQWSADNRIMQMQEINRIAALDSQSFIIAGDFNDPPASETINLLDRSFTRTCKYDCVYTFPEINPSKTIDFIAFRPAKAFTITSTTVLNEQYASDHLPVVSILKIR